MLTPSRSLALHAGSGTELPKVPGLNALYGAGVKPRHGEVIMIAGRGGTQKSGLALWYVSQMNLPTVYFSADMSPMQASIRLVCSTMGQTTLEVERGIADGFTDVYQSYLKDSQITFSFGMPLRFEAVDREMDAYVELHDRFPEVVVFDNLMDFDGADSEYSAQMEVMSSASGFARDTGASVIVLHHASDKTWSARDDPWAPPNRAEIKNGLVEKAELALTVALDAHTLDYRIACVKQRMGPSDPTARSFVTLTADPARTQFRQKLRM
jgi:hypothetical protein